jgi:chromosome segregation ATPase
MGYLERAKQWMDKHEGEQSRATIALAFAAVAIAERMDTWKQDSEETDDLIDLQIEEQSSMINKLEQGLNKLDGGVTSLGLWRETVRERLDAFEVRLDNISMNGLEAEKRLDELGLQLTAQGEHINILSDQSHITELERKLGTISDAQKAAHKAFGPMVKYTADLPDHCPIYVEVKGGYSIEIDLGILREILKQ